MLVLCRKKGERIVIGPSVVVTVLEITGSCVRLGLEAPGDVRILREEVWNRIQGLVPTPAVNPRRLLKKG
jgi:carbon storage regulator